MNAQKNLKVTNAAIAVSSGFRLNDARVGQDDVMKLTLKDNVFDKIMYEADSTGSPGLIKDFTFPSFTRMSLVDIEGNCFDKITSPQYNSEAERNGPSFFFNLQNPSNLIENNNFEGCDRRV